jgi:NAD dependent epimerase/dehydratase family enzyme
MRDVVVTGANGWIGGRVGSLLEQRGLRVIGVSRHPEQARAKRPQWRWIGTGPELEEAVERASVVVNLAGRNPVERPWTPEFVTAGQPDQDNRADRRRAPAVTDA